jgi:predicted membrane metal-binding protein
VLLVWDARPGLFPAGSHDFLGAFSLAMIAIAYLVYQLVHRPPIRELLKAVLLAVAFLFWAANQLWPNLPQATLFNDIAIALFVLDVFLVMAGWPGTSPDESFGEAYAEPTQKNPN